MLGGLGKLITSQTSRQAAKAALPGAALNFGVGTLTQGPIAGLAYAAGDFLLNYPVVGAARKMFPGTPAGTATIVTKGGKTITKELPYMPSSVESGLNLGASLASMPLVDAVTGGALYNNQAAPEPTNMSQEQQIYQQATQRQQINHLQQQALSRGTQFQTQGLEHTFHYPGVTLPPETLAMLQSAS
jgi:hypothetical protein